TGPPPFERMPSMTCWKTSWNMTTAGPSTSTTACRRSSARRRVNGDGRFTVTASTESFDAAPVTNTGPPPGSSCSFATACAPTEAPSSCGPSARRAAAPGFSPNKVQQALLRLFHKIRKNCYGEREEDGDFGSDCREKVWSKPYESQL
ncbi:hypothetical protein Z043_111533, partial [Scleropages formosus]